MPNQSYAASRSRSTDDEPEFGSPCQRCGRVVGAVECYYADYWLCRECGRLHVRLMLGQWPPWAADARVGP